MQVTADQSRVPLSLSDIRNDIQNHGRDGWNFIGATTEGMHEEVVLRYRRSRGSSIISSGAVADTVIEDSEPRPTIGTLALQ